MPKNTGMGGNKRKKGKKPVAEDRDLIYKGESEEYAQVIKILGDGRFECNCADGVKRIAHVRGKMRKRIWIANGDIILVSLRDFEPEKCDVVEKYREKEVAKLKKVGEIPDSMVYHPHQMKMKKKKKQKTMILFLKIKKMRRLRKKMMIYNIIMKKKRKRRNLMKKRKKREMKMKMRIKKKMRKKKKKKKKKK